MHIYLRSTWVFVLLCLIAAVNRESINSTQRSVGPQPRVLAGDELRADVALCWTDVEGVPVDQLQRPPEWYRQPGSDPPTAPGSGAHRAPGERWFSSLSGSHQEHHAGEWGLEVGDGGQARITDQYPWHVRCGQQHRESSLMLCVHLSYSYLYLHFHVYISVKVLSVRI